MIACKLARHTGCHYVVNSTGRVRQENLQADLQLALDRRFGYFEVKAVGIEETPEAVLGALAQGVARLAIRKPEDLLEAFRRNLESSRTPASDIPAKIS